MQRVVGVGGGRLGLEMKETRKASTEFDGVIAPTSETVTRKEGEPQKTSPQGGTVFHQLITSHQLDIQLHAVYRTRPAYSR